MEGNYSFNIFPIYSTTFHSKYKNKRANVPSNKLIFNCTLFTNARGFHGNES